MRGVAVNQPDKPLQHQRPLCPRPSHIGRVLFGEHDPERGFPVSRPIVSKSAYPGGNAESKQQLNRRVEHVFLKRTNKPIFMFARLTKSDTRVPEQL